MNDANYRQALLDVLWLLHNFRFNQHKLKFTQDEMENLTNEIRTKLDESYKLPRESK